MSANLDIVCTKQGNVYTIVLKRNMKTYVSASLSEYSMIYQSVYYAHEFVRDDRFWENMAKVNEKLF